MRLTVQLQSFDLPGWCVCLSSFTWLSYSDPHNDLKKAAALSWHLQSCRLLATGLPGQVSGTNRVLLCVIVLTEHYSGWIKKVGSDCQCMTRNCELLLHRLDLSNQCIVLIFEFASEPNHMQQNCWTAQSKSSVYAIRWIDVWCSGAIWQRNTIVPYNCDRLRDTRLAIIGLRQLIFPCDGSHSDGLNRFTLGGQWTPETSPRICEYALHERMIRY